MQEGQRKAGPRLMSFGVTFDHGQASRQGLPRRQALGARLAFVVVVIETIDCAWSAHAAFPCVYGAAGRRDLMASAEELTVSEKASAQRDRRRVAWRRRRLLAPDHHSRSAAVAGLVVGHRRPSIGRRQLMQFCEDLDHVGRQHRLLLHLGFSAVRHELVFSGCDVEEGLGRHIACRTALAGIGAMGIAARVDWVQGGRTNWQSCSGFPGR